MLSLLDLLNEGKQVGLLYHYTKEERLRKILEDNELKPSVEDTFGHKKYYISFTRDKNYHRKNIGFGVFTEYRITIDGDKLSENYRIQPFSFDFSENYKYDKDYEKKIGYDNSWIKNASEIDKQHFFNNTEKWDEQEERINFGKVKSSIKNIKKYILNIENTKDIPPNK